MMSFEEKFYSSPQEVINYTGISPDDLGIELTENDGYKTRNEKLESIIKTWLIQAKDLIDNDRNRDFHKEVEDGELSLIPPGIHLIAKRIVSNMVAMAQIRRQTSVVQVEQYEVDMVQDKIFTNMIKKDLKNYPKKTKFNMFVVKSEDD